MSDSRPLAIVTGASTGIGLELARLCAENGHDLLIAADEPAIETAATELRAHGAKVDALNVDLSTIEGVETLAFGGSEVELYAIHFDKERMRLKIPVMKAKTSGLRRLSSKERLKSAMETLQGRSRSKRVMWSRRAQEYETKINSGDPVSIAEVLRDLRRADDQSEQSYSERQIYQSALDRLARELAAVEKIDEGKAAERLEEVLKKAA